VVCANCHRRRTARRLPASSFSREAVEYAESVTPRVIMVDGEELARLMIDHGVGVAISTRYEIKRIDLDYFGVEDEPTANEPAEQDAKERN
jgi:restriction system protein